MQLIKTLSVLALATGAVVAFPSHAHVHKRQWSGINRWWNRPSADASITVTGYAAQPTDWNADDETYSTAAATTTAVAAAATPTYGGNFYNKPSADAAPLPLLPPRRGLLLRQPRLKLPAVVLPEARVITWPSFPNGAPPVVYLRSPRTANSRVTP